MLSSVLAALRPPSPAEESPQRPPRYAGEDTRPTSQREILGWYAYGIAAEVFAVSGVGVWEGTRILLRISGSPGLQDPFSL